MAYLFSNLLVRGIDSTLQRQLVLWKQYGIQQLVLLLLSGSGLTGSSNQLIPVGPDGGNTPAKGTNKFIAATGDKEFKVQIKDSDTNVVIDTKFNFTNSSENFISKVFNTNPTLTNTAITLTTNKAYRKYWLGQTFEDEVNALLTGNSSHVGVMLPLYSAGGTANGGDFRRDFSDPETGYFIAQDLTNLTLDR